METFWINQRNENKIKNKQSAIKVFKFWSTVSLIFVKVKTNILKVVSTLMYAQSNVPIQSNWTNNI